MADKHKQVLLCLPITGYGVGFQGILFANLTMRLAQLAHQVLLFLSEVALLQT